MEFSFDRSRDSSARRPDSQTQSQPQANSQQSAGPRPGPDLNTVDPSTIANERLRKAIERNRSKQAERDAQRPAQSFAQPQQQQQAAPQAEQQQGSFFSQSSHLSQEDQAHIAQQEALREANRQANMEAMRAREAQKQAEYAAYAQHAQQAANSEREEHREQMRQEAKQQAPQMPPEAPRAATESQSPRARLRARMAGAAKVAEANGTMNNENVDTTPMPSKGTSVVSRRSVAKPDDTEFVPVKRTPKKVASQISYTTTSTRKKQKSMDPKYVNWLVKGSWIFCGLMVLRLIFATGGVTDFYSQKGAVSDRLAELSDIKKENMQLVREIERMRSDAGFQKKLVRDNLGFIAADEFLVLFPK